MDATRHRRHRGAASHLGSESDLTRRRRLSPSTCLRLGRLQATLCRAVLLSFMPDARLEGAQLLLQVGHAALGCAGSHVQRVEGRRPLLPTRREGMSQ